MEGFLALGFLIGMQHALEADHIAAIGAMASGGPASKRNLTLRGAVWGLGHTITLFAVCAAVLLLGFSLDDQTSALLEFCVGIMLVLLGADVIRRMYKKKVHFHVHTHGSGKPHFHAHSHLGSDAPHQKDSHDHRHPNGFPMRALFVGLTHGAAGSAGLLALAIAGTQDPWIALGYVLVFGIGSILGMAVLSFAAALPLGFAETRAKLLYSGLSWCAAGLAVFLGIKVMSETATAALFGG